MNNNILHKFNILILIFSFFLSYAPSEAMEIVDKEKDSSKHNRYFYKHKKEELSSSSLISDITNNASDTESCEDVGPDNVIYSKIKRSSSLSAINPAKKIYQAVSSKVRKKPKHKGADTEEKGDVDNPTVTLEGFIDTTSSSLDPSVHISGKDEIKKIPRQRSWGKNATIVRKDKHPSENVQEQDFLETPPQSSRSILSSQQTNNFSGEPASTDSVAITEQYQRSKERPFRNKIPRLGFSSEALTLNNENDYLPPRNQRSMNSVSHESLLETKRYNTLMLSQGRNPLEEGLSLHLDESGQPLACQPISPRQKTPREKFELGEEKKSKQSEEHKNSKADTVLIPFEVERPEPALKYNEKRGNAQVIRVMDNRFFRSDFRWVMGCGFVGGLTFGVPSPTAMTGVIVNVTGYTFGIPPGGWLSTTLVTTFMTTFTLALLMEGYEFGKYIGQPMWQRMKACYSCYTGTKEQEEGLSIPLFRGAEYSWKIGYKNSLLHYGINGFTLIGAGVHNGLLPVALLSLVWSKHYSELVIPFGVFLFIRYTGQDYNSTRRVIRYLFKDYLNQEPDGNFIYTANALKDENIEDNFHIKNMSYEQANSHRDLMHEKIQRSLSDMEENDEVAEEKYNIINAERDKIRQLTFDKKEYFALSALMDRTTVHERESIAFMLRVNSHLFSPSKVRDVLNYMNILYQKASTQIRKPIVILKVSCKGSALIGAGIAIEQGFKIFWGFWLPNSAWAMSLTEASTGTIFTFYTINQLFHIAKAVKEYNTPKAPVANVSNFSLASFGAVVPAGFSTMVGVILGFQSVDESGSSQKWKALMVPYAIDTYLSGHTHLKNKLQDFLTATVTTIPECIKETGVACTPQAISSGCGRVTNCCFSKCYNSLSEYIPSFIRGIPSRFYKRCWLRKWHNRFDEEAQYDYDPVTLAALDFTILESSFDDSYFDEESSSTYGSRVENHFHLDDSSNDY